MGRCSITGLSGPVGEVIKELVLEVGVFDVDPLPQNENPTKNGLQIEVFDGAGGPSEPEDYTIVPINISESNARELLKVITEIRPRVTANGVDTDNLTPNQEEALMGRHPALADLYLSSAGGVYRNHCSSREKAYMIEEFDKNAVELEKLKNMSCFKCNSSSGDAVYQVLMDAVFERMNWLHS